MGACALLVTQVRGLVKPLLQPLAGIRREVAWASIKHRLEVPVQRKLL
jgi:hypothetical protein